MGALAALYKPFDPSLQNVIKYIYLLYIFFCFLLTVPFYPRKKRKQKSREWKRKNQTRCINLAICFYPVALLSIDVFFFHLSLFTCMSFFVVVVKINKNLKKNCLVSRHLSQWKGGKEKQARSLADLLWGEE